MQVRGKIFVIGETTEHKRDEFYWDFLELCKRYNVAVDRIVSELNMRTREQGATVMVIKKTTGLRPGQIA